MVLESELKELNVKKTNRDECQIFELEISKPPFKLYNYGSFRSNKTYKAQFNMKISTAIRTYNSTYKEYKEFSTNLL